MSPMRDVYVTDGGVEVTRTVDEISVEGALDDALNLIDTHRGAVFASGYEYPGRYSRWDMAFVDPPLEIVSQGRSFTIRSLNERGARLLRIMAPALDGHVASLTRRTSGSSRQIASLDVQEKAIHGTIRPMPDYFPEEERSKQPTIFSVLRALIRQMHSPVEQHLGLYGALGYDIVFQFEPIEFRRKRDAGQPDLHLFLPDELIIVDHRKEQATRRRYDFRLGETTTAGVPRGWQEMPLQRGSPSDVSSDHQPGQYADKVRLIQEGCRRGDFFEVVLSQVFTAGYAGTPRELFETIRSGNPSPYEFLINLGREQLVGASPEMFVRVDGTTVETCPISGTVKRGATPIEDADAILSLLNSKKDEAELTMCTDVDRNDKSRVCKAGTVRVVGRRMIEIYSKLIHTVDHVVGELREDCDALDALLSHMWACTLTGAPKPAAMQKIEDLENSPREWYGACVGVLSFSGAVNTGITIRTVHLRDGTARVRVGATLLVDSDPDEEEQETRTKASAFVEAVLAPTRKPAEAKRLHFETGVGKKVLFVDNRDSFVHTLANYVRRRTWSSSRLGRAPHRTSPCLLWCGRAWIGACPCSAYAWVCRAWSRRSGATWACYPIPCTARSRSSRATRRASSRDSRSDSSQAGIIHCTRSLSPCRSV